MGEVDTVLGDVTDEASVRAAMEGCDAVIHAASMNALRGMYRFLLPGGMAVCDVRDVARLHASVLEPGRGPRRYLVHPRCSRCASGSSGSAR